MTYFVAILSGIIGIAGWVLGINQLIWVGGVIMLVLFTYLTTANAVIRMFTGEDANDHELELVSRQLIRDRFRKRTIRK